ncbi:copper homeostasis periplasmic binding protein CopC [Sphingomonas sp. GlSt437]|uniref:copper homeostasis periplasmic binding protein CopC n=1 Tax=Sphingomonas sp. GlSt437 TaxID=3389970 RepID=UPI003A85CB70
MKFVIKSAIGIGLASIMMISTAQAHPRIVSSTPAANGAIAKPSRLTIRFSERLVGPLTGATLVSVRAGHVTTIPTATALDLSNKILIVKLAQPLAAGRYQLDWHAVSVDTHRVQGSLAFRAI